MAWLEKAAENNHRRAQTKLGIAYYRGQSIRKNKVMAHMWLSLSGDAEAARMLAEIDPTLSTVQRRDSRRRQAKWRAEHPQFAEGEAADSAEEIQ
jgi:hypothetical protein